jgi:hypothetical protein
VHERGRTSLSRRASPPPRCPPPVRWPARAP